MITKITIIDKAGYVSPIDLSLVFAKAMTIPVPYNEKDIQSDDIEFTIDGSTYKCELQRRFYRETVLNTKKIFGLKNPFYKNYEYTLIVKDWELHRTQHEFSFSTKFFIGSEEIENIKVTFTDKTTIEGKMR